MKVLIIGASGLVGNYLVKILSVKHQVCGTYHRFVQPGLVKLDLEEKKAVQNLINQFKPDWVLLPAAYADVDGCEKNPSLCRRINWQGGKNVVEAVQEKNLGLVFFSTDYVFDGKNGPYQEEDQPNPLSVYGQVKLQMENYIKNNLNKYLIIRTANVFGWEKQEKNFVIRTIRFLNQEKPAPLPVVADQTVTPTYAGFLAKAVAYLIEHNHRGLYHVAGAETLSRYHFALLIAQVFGLAQNLIKPVKTSQTGQAAPRPAKGGLKTDKIKKILPFAVPSAKESLLLMKNEKNAF